jgi:hypothetical protein
MIAHFGTRSIGRWASGIGRADPAIVGTKDDVQAAIKRLDDCIVWRRTARVEDIDFMFDDVEYEVSHPASASDPAHQRTALQRCNATCDVPFVPIPFTCSGTNIFVLLTIQSTTGKNLVLGFTPRGQPVIYFFPNRNTTPLDKRRAIHAVRPSSRQFSSFRPCSFTRQTLPPLACR